MSTITIKITAPESEFITLASELKYQDLVSKTEEELALLVEPIAIQDRLKPNPQSKQAFVEEYFHKINVQELYRHKALIIDNQVNEAKVVEKAALKAVIDGVVTVNFVA